MKNIFKILQLAKPMHNIMFMIVFVVVLGAVFEVVTPLLSGQILDEVIQQAANENKEYGRLIRLLGISLTATLAYLIMRSIGQRLGDHLAGKIRKYLTETFYDKAFTLPQSYYDSEVSGKIINQLNRGISSIQQFINTATNFIVPIFLQGIIVIGVLAYYDWILALLMVGIFPIYFALSRISTQRWGAKEEVKT